MSKNPLWIIIASWFILCVVATTVWIFFGGDEQTRLYYYYYASSLNLITGLTTAFFCYRNTRLFPQRDPLHRAWKYLGIGLGFWSFGALLSLLYALQKAAPTPFPWYSDIGYLMFAPFTFLALIALRMSLNVSVPFWALIGAFIIAMLTSGFVLFVNADVLKSIGVSAFMTTMGYVVVNPTLLATIMTTASVLKDRLICRPWWFALAGLFLFFIGDLLHVVFHNVGKPENEIWLDLTWPISFGLIAISATTTCSLSRKLTLNKK